MNEQSEMSGKIIFYAASAVSAPRRSRLGYGAVKLTLSNRHLNHDRVGLHADHGM
jgi:hypothetical protein